MFSVYDLACNDLTDPRGVGGRPRLSWRLGSDEADTRQVACQVVVMSPYLGVLRWDSGRVRTSAQALVYEGEPLAPEEVCTWYVTAWDNHGNESASVPATFELGAREGEDDGLWMPDFPLRRTGEVMTSDRRLNRSLEDECRALRSLLVDQNAPGSSLDRLAQVGRALAPGPAALFSYDANALLREWLARLRRARQPEGDRAFGDADLEAACAWVPWRLYEVYGQEAVLKENLSMMERWAALSQNRLAALDKDKDEDKDEDASGEPSGLSAVAVDVWHRVLGVHILQAGMRRLRISPDVGCGLAFAQGSLLSPQGLVWVRWEREEEGVRLEAHLPPGTDATLELGERHMEVGPGAHVVWDR